MRKAKFSNQDIAQEIGVDRSTIYRELKRNSGERGYRPKQAHEKAMLRRFEAVKFVKMTPSLTTLVEEKIKGEWSPEQISGWLLFEEGISLSHERIYQHIWADKQNGGALYLHLRRQGKKYEKRRNGRSARGQIKDRVGIEERPSVVDLRTRVGDWEIDTVIGKGHKGALVTIVERKTQHLVSKRVMDKSAESVTQATIELLKPYIDRVHTITADNGKEFANHKEIAEKLKTKVYFARPYHSWERGLNENSNGLLRQYFPKSTDFTMITDNDVENAVNAINTRPRKTLLYKTPQSLMQRSLAWGYN
jgi:IS30 family transposase